MPSDAQLMDMLADTVDDMTGMVPDIKSLYFGDTGMGKTVLGMQVLQEFVPEDKEILFIDSARGWVSLNNHPELKRRTRRMQFMGLSQLDVLRKAIESGHPKFKDIGGIQFDEISSMQEHDLEVTRIGRGESTGDYAAPTQPDMGVTTYRFRRTFDPMLRLPLHMALISHMREDEVKIGSKATGKYIIRPAMMPKVSQMIRGLVHEVIYISADVQGSPGSTPSYARTLQVMPTSKINAKTRVGGLQPVVSPAQYMVALKEWAGGKRPTANAKLDEVEVPVEELSDAILVD